MIFKAVIIQFQLDKRLEAAYETPHGIAIHPIAKEMTQMTSKTHKIKMIRKHKKHVHKTNRKTDQKRIDQNHALLFPKAG